MRVRAILLFVVGLALACGGGGANTPSGPCANDCSAAGQTRCAGSQVQTCRSDATGCFAWSAPTGCPSGQACSTISGQCVVPDVPRSWTIFVYGHADHNLSPSLLVDVQEMNEAAIQPHVNVIVAADYRAGFVDPHGHPVTIPWTGAALPSGTEWYRIVGGSQPPVLVGTAAEQNFDDPAVLRAAVAATLRNYPADRYAVVMWDHGASWQGGFGGDWNNDPGTRNATTPMSAAEVATALAGALQDAGIGGVKPFEFVAFDTCLMAGNEVTYEFRDVAKTYLACAEVDYGNGWDYTSTWTWISGNPAATGAELAQHEVAYWDAHHSAASGADQLMRAHVALDMTKFTAFADGWKQFVAAIRDSADFDALGFARAQYGTEPGYGFKSDPSWTAHLRDAGLFLSRASLSAADATIAASASAAATELNDATIAASLGSIRADAGQKGVHFEMPTSKNWGTQANQYRALAWDQYTWWSTVLDSLAAIADSTAPIVNTIAVNTSNPDAVSPPRVSLWSPDMDVAEVRVYIASVHGGDLYSFGLAGQRLIAPATEYVFTWPGRLFVLTDGNHASYITLLPWLGGSSPMYLVPGVITLSAARYEALAALDGSTSEVASYFVNDGSGHWSTSGSDALIGLTFTPLIYEATSHTTTDGTALSITPTPLAAAISSAPAGSYQIVTEMSDVWGNWGSKSDDVTIVTPF